MKVLIVNQHTENFGDDAAGDALQALLAESPSELDITVVYNGPESTRPHGGNVSAPTGIKFRDIGLLGLVGYFAAPRWLARRRQAGPLARLVRIISAADHVIVAPAGANLGIYRDWQYLVRLLMVLREGKTPIFHWNTVGRSGNLIFDALALRVFKRSRMYVREAASLKFLESVGVGAEVGFDTAFALPVCDLEIRQDVISVVPSELDSWHPEFRIAPVNDVILGPVAEALSSFANKHRMSVEILPHLRSDGEREFNDAFRGALLRNGLQTHRVRIREDVRDVRDYDRALASSRLVVGGRYHAVILAAKNHRPFVSLSYENKMVEACRYLGVPQLSVDLHRQELVPRLLTDGLEECLVKEREIAAVLRKEITGAILPRLRLPLLECGLLGGATVPSRTLS